DINYLNPIIFFRPVEFSLASPDNALMGANTKINIINNIMFYGQFILDDLDIKRSKDSTGFILNKYGYQLGIKSYNFAKVEGLNLLAEYNRVRPYVYAHKTPLQNYSHYSQPIAHPYGANFYEFVGMAAYNYKRFSFNIKVNIANYGADNDTTNWGGNIFLSEYQAQRGSNSYGNEVGQGIATDLFFGEATIKYYINPASNINVFLSVAHRKLNSINENYNNTLITFGIKTDMFNFYNDF
ncbi:MAG: hypothetical protein KAG95_07055, partial [Bacteroidales bacterium]|nr:hypothetical protein [Bacteroidales bacterium]